jgi:hypothetical protein
MISQYDATAGSSVRPYQLWAICADSLPAVAEAFPRFRIVTLDCPDQTQEPIQPDALPVSQRISNFCQPPLNLPHRDHPLLRARQERGLRELLDLISN